MAETIHATFKTSMGEIVVKLLPEKAPKTVANFLELAEGTKEWTDPRSGQKVKKPLYDGTIFHRVIPDFMIQGGDPLGTGTGGPGYKFADEIGPDNSFSKPGLLAMANAGPNTNGSQFFITEVTTPHLNPRPCRESQSGVCGYVRFGQGVCGCERVEEIAKAGSGQTRLEKVEITSKSPSCR
jgi:peptidyl-prolyl cis-trans isomerase A (cyclophilin A)